MLVFAMAAHARAAQLESKTDEEPGESRASDSDGAAQDARDAENASRLKTPKSIVFEAYQKTRTASNEAGFTEVLDLCQRALDEGAKGESAAYARRLMGWAYNRRGEARAARGKEDDALADFNQAVEHDPQHWRAVHNRGVSYATAGKHEEAMRDFDRTLELNQSYPNAWFNRGELRYEQGDYVGAISDYDRALELAPEDTAAYNSRGHAYYRTNRFREALADYGQAVRFDPANGAALTNRGDAHADMGNFGAAARDYREAIRVSPKLGRAYQSAAWLMATCPQSQFRNARLALDAAEKAIEIDGDGDYRYLETLAAAQAAAGEFEDAVKTQERAIELAPHDAATRNQERLTLYRRKQAYVDAPRTLTRPQMSSPIGRSRRN